MTLNGKAQHSTAGPKSNKQAGWYSLQADEGKAAPAESSLAAPQVLTVVSQLLPWLLLQLLQLQADYAAGLHADAVAAAGAAADFVIAPVDLLLQSGATATSQLLQPEAFDSQPEGEDLHLQLTLLWHNAEE